MPKGCPKTGLPGTWSKHFVTKAKWACPTSGNSLFRTGISPIRPPTSFDFFSLILFCLSKYTPMSGEPVKTKLTDEERLARINVSKRAYEAKNSSLRREYRLAYAAAQRQVLLDAGFVPRPVGRPPSDPENVILKVGAKRERGDKYREYQRNYQRLLRARRREEGWIPGPCGYVPPGYGDALLQLRQRCVILDIPTSARSSDQN